MSNEPNYAGPRVHYNCDDCNERIPFGDSHACPASPQALLSRIEKLEATVKGLCALEETSYRKAYRQIQKEEFIYDSRIEERD